MKQGITVLKQPEGEAHQNEINRIQALRVLSEVTATLASEYDLEALLDRFLGMMVRLSGASAGIVRVLTSDGRHLKLAASQGLPPELVETAGRPSISNPAPPAPASLFSAPAARWSSSRSSTTGACSASTTST